MNVWETNRRTVLTSMAAAIPVGVAGCTSANDGPDAEEEDDCRTETRTEEVLVVDDRETILAGETTTMEIELQVGDELLIQTRSTDETRPSLVVENPSGDVLASVPPSELIIREVIANEDGAYAVTFENTADDATGEWTVEIYHRREYEETVCG